MNDKEIRAEKEKTLARAVKGGSGGFLRKIIEVLAQSRGIAKIVTALRGKSK
ncbi:hypothetical protein KAH81_05985 [bacterium]|nr:hypothetical protein [bacterium]